MIKDELGIQREILDHTEKLLEIELSWERRVKRLIDESRKNNRPSCTLNHILEKCEKIITIRNAERKQYQEEIDWLEKRIMEFFWEQQERQTVNLGREEL